MPEPGEQTGELPGFAAAKPPLKLKSILKKTSTIALKEKMRQETEKKIRGWYEKGLKMNPVSLSSNQFESAVHAYAPEPKSSSGTTKPPVVSAAKPPAYKDLFQNNDRKRAAEAEHAVAAASISEYPDPIDLPFHVPRKKKVSQPDPPSVATTAAAAPEDSNISPAAALEDANNPPAAALEDSNDPLAAAPEDSNNNPPAAAPEDSNNNPPAAAPEDNPPADGSNTKLWHDLFGKHPQNACENAAAVALSTSAQLLANETPSKRQKRSPMKSSSGTPPVAQRQGNVNRRMGADNSPEAARSIAHEALHGVPHGRKKAKSAAKPKPTKKEPSKKKKEDGESPTPRDKRPSAKEIFCGEPDDDVGVDWTGWTKKTFRRQSGQTAGSTDSYWYTPVLRKKLRSLKEVDRFLDHMKNCGNDEEKAWKMLKGK